MDEKISVLVPTYRRNLQLGALLEDLARQTRLPDEVVVVDNDAAGGAAGIVRGFAARAPFAVRYDIQPEKNISLTRNRAVELAGGSWMAMLDDDERVGPDWLALMMDCAREHAADGVLGPLVCQPPADAPAWIRRGRVYALPRAQTGSIVALNRMWVHNCVLRAGHVRRQSPAFDPALGISGGEDGDFMTRLAADGARLIWCDEAVATEPVSAERLNLKWVLLRAYAGGQGHASCWRRGRYGALGWHAWPVYIGGALAKCLLAAVLSLLTLPLGFHHAVNWARRSAANAGKLSALSGRRYLAYAAAPGGSPSAGSPR